MAFRVQFNQKSVEDIDSIIEYYMAQNERAAETIYRSLIKKAESLEDFAERGRMVPELLDEDVRHIRELIDGNFRIIYRINDKTAEILRVIDSRQLLKMNID